MRFENYGQKKKDVVAPYLTYKQAQKRKQKQRRKDLLSDVSRAGRTDAEKERERILLSNPTTRASYDFVSTRTGATKSFHGVEFTEFTAWPNQKVVHGVITITEYDDNGMKKGESTEDLYMYQPRFEGRQNVAFGPKYKDDGTMNNNAQYAVKDPETGEIYVGSIPKREILSNRQFDFDTSNMNIFNSVCSSVLEENNKQLRNIVSIKYDRDNTGRIRAVDLTDAEEKKKLDAYVKKYSTPTKASAMLDKLVQDIKKEVLKAEKIEAATQEAVARVSMANNLRAQAQADAEKANNNQTPTLADENAKLINNMLKYGIKPTYASPMQGGGPVGGPGMPPPPPPSGLFGGPEMAPPPPGGGGRHR